MPLILVELQKPITTGRPCNAWVRRYRVLQCALLFISSWFVTPVYCRGHWHCAIMLSKSGTNLDGLRIAIARGLGLHWRRNGTKGSLACGAPAVPSCVAAAAVNLWIWGCLIRVVFFYMQMEVACGRTIPCRPGPGWMDMAEHPPSISRPSRGTGLAMEIKPVHPEGHTGNQ